MTKPQIGVLLPTREMAMLGDYTMDPLLDFARQAEDVGFDSVWTGDSLMARPRLDPFVVLAGVAAVTDRVTLGTAALTAALRHPVIGANMVASLHHACAGRLELGLGSGFPIPETAEEFAAVGVEFDQRVGRLDEIVKLWRKAWATRGSGTGGGGGEPPAVPEAARYDGRYWQVGDLDRLPPVATERGPRLWLAASNTPRVLRRVASLYDGWLPFLPTAEAYAQAWRTISEQAEAGGRSPDSIVAGMYATIAVNSDRDAARAQLEDYVQRYYGRPLEVMSTVQAYAYGTAEECAQWLASYVAAGARHLVIRIGSLEPAAQLKEIARAVHDGPLG